MEVRHSVQAAEPVGVCRRDPGAIAGGKGSAVEKKLDEPRVRHPAVRGRAPPELGSGGDRPGEVPGSELVGEIDGEVVGSEVVGEVGGDVVGSNMVPCQQKSKISSDPRRYCSSGKGTMR